MYKRQILFLISNLSCREEIATSGTQTAQSCAESDLIAQCPVGTRPILEAEAMSSCDSSG